MKTESRITVGQKEGELLRCLKSIETDLQLAKQEAERYLSMIANGPVDPMVAQAFSTSITIRYGRAFAKGRQHHISPAKIKGLDSAIQVTHEWFLIMRNKFIAHSANDLERTTILARFES